MRKKKPESDTSSNNVFTQNKKKKKIKINCVDLDVCATNLKTS